MVLSLTQLHGPALCKVRPQKGFVAFSVAVARRCCQQNLQRLLGRAFGSLRLQRERPGRKVRAKGCLVVSSPGHSK